MKPTTMIIPINIRHMVLSGMSAAILLAFAARAEEPRNMVIAPLPVGKSVKVENMVRASLGDRPLQVRDSVFANESISAGPDSYGEIILDDDSKVLVGENSVVSLDDFVRAGRGFQSGSIHVAKGAFRFITGNSQKGFLQVHSPLSTIGVRGTLFDVYVTDSGVTRVVLFRGEVEVCAQGNCITTNNACDIVEANENGLAELPYLRSGDRDEENDTYNLATLQKRFSRAFRAPVNDCAWRALLDPKVNKRNRNPPSDGPGGKPSMGGQQEKSTGSPCAMLDIPELKAGVMLAQTAPPGPAPCT